jgi:translation elongation factor P/translation initiation factor 5A
LKNEKIFRATEMIDMWRVEKEKFDVLMKDDGALEKKIMNLY